MIIRLTHIDEIPEGRGLLVTTPSGEKIALFREGNNVFGIQDACPHKGASLSEGTCYQGIVTCPLHLWEFSAKDGHCLTRPGKNARCYNIHVDNNGEVYLENP